MIRHIVFFSASKPEDVQTIQDGLMMLRDIPHSQHFEVGRNLQSDGIAGAQVDLVVYAEFADEAALAAYKADPIYTACIARVRPLRELRIAADFKATVDN
ncbi:Stress responsive A/B Barrel Domain protein [Roseovarius litorisediminis]|uniref:Stress responsive A/B Barrel Domain protein n=1 Tax=Roseovarius litorisediminis TaxID=1312363 RepID=A0A1Y5T325_9RHOB|nr:Dabb family protein [Roseovarius litorisediminis]SLN54690.1 Stress responsive A/B Barrel Domain protein [Roseovarius litorisediminis]